MTFARTGRTVLSQLMSGRDRRDDPTEVISRGRLDCLKALDRRVDVSVGDWTPIELSRSTFADGDASVRRSLKQQQAGRPLALCSKPLSDKELSDEASGVAASGQRRSGSTSPSMPSDVAVPAAPRQSKGVPLPPALSRIVESWPRLPPHVREAIQMLVDAGS